MKKVWYSSDEYARIRFALLVDFSIDSARFDCKDRYNLLNDKSLGVNIPGRHITIIQ